MSNKLASRLKQVLVSRGLNSKALSAGTGLSPSRVSDLLAGRTPSLKNLLIIANYLKVSTDYLLGIEEDFPEEKRGSVINQDFSKVLEFEDTFKITITVTKDNKKKKEK